MRRLTSIALLGMAATIIAGIILYGGKQHLQAGSGAISEKSRSLATDAQPTVWTSASEPATASAQQEPGDDGERERRAHGDWVRAIVHELLQRGDANSLAVAALLMESMSGYFTGPTEKRSQFRQRTLALYQRAAAEASADPVMQWLALAACRTTAVDGVDCEAAEYDRALRASDPSNALNWLGELETSMAQSDATQGAQALASMARATRFDDYSAAIDALKLKVLESVRVPPPTTSLQDEMRPMESLLQARGPRGVRPMQPLIQSCASSASDALRSNCRQIAQSMRREGSTHMTFNALNLALALAQPNSAEAHALALEQRRLDWQRDQLMQLIRAQGQASRYMQAGNNLQQLQTLLRDQGIPLDPPEEWSR